MRSEDDTLYVRLETDDVITMDELNTDDFQDLVDVLISIDE